MTNHWTATLREMAALLGLLAIVTFYLNTFIHPHPLLLIAFASGCAVASAVAAVARLLFLLVPALRLSLQESRQ
ncbi:MAG: hypothetical protein M0T79_09765 [Actinomycetota bacterium]|nr:hypothetical protein [Actinomycetota bacterium]